MTTLTALDTVLSVLHDRGIVNEDELRTVCAELLAAGDEAAPTRDQLIRIFGQAAIYREMTVSDDTRVQLLREAIDLFDNQESHVDLRDWLKTARRIVGPTEAR